jgi:hypothetical protein
MKDYGTVRSTVKPEAMVVDDFSVWINSDVKAVSEKGTDKQEGFTGFEYQMIQYDKDEYIKLMSEKNSNLESQLTDTQETIVSLYEQLNK